MKLPVEDTSAVVSGLLVWSLMEAESDEQANAAQQAAASITNKRLAGSVVFNSATSQVYLDVYTPDVIKFTENDIPAFWNREVTHDEGGPDRRRRALDAYTWVGVNSSCIMSCRSDPMPPMQIVKALLVRNHPDTAHHIHRYFSAFSDPQIGRDAAKALGTLGTGGERILTKANYAVLGVSAYGSPWGWLLTLHFQLLHVQKFFNSILPRILDGYQASVGTRS